MILPLVNLYNSVVFLDGIFFFFRRTVYFNKSAQISAICYKTWLTRGLQNISLIHRFINKTLMRLETEWESEWTNPAKSCVWLIVRLPAISPLTSETELSRFINKPFRQNKWHPWATTNKRESQRRIADSMKYIKTDYIWQQTPVFNL